MVKKQARRPTALMRVCGTAFVKERGNDYMDL